MNLVISKQIFNKNRLEINEIRLKNKTYNGRICREGILFWAKK